MLSDDVYAAVLAFLDQFIARGAARDIREVRRRLADDPEVRKLLEGQLPNDHPSTREAFDAMRAFLEIEYQRQPQRRYEDGPDLVDLLSWARWESANADGHFDAAGALEMTGDPAQWHDWLASVERVSTSV